MKWGKKGLIYCPNGKYGWDYDSALTPTPIILDNKTIRVFVSMRDKSGVGRIGFIDVDINNPIKIKNISERPILDIGLPGTFDDNGIILGDIILIDNIYYMFYVGFQIVQKVKFLAFTGLAFSDDGSTFKRTKNTPILDRSDEGLFIRAIHTIIKENGIFKIWYATGSGQEYINGKPFPKYCIMYQESKDHFSFKENGILCIEPNAERGEYRIGRPRVYKIDNKYIMFYTYGTIKGDYLIGYAESYDGIKWIRKDYYIGIGLSSTGWDSKHICYPSLIFNKDRVYMFYNGNEMGKTGFGYAELISWD